MPAGTRRGALIAIERGSRRVRALIESARPVDLGIHVVAGCRGPGVARRCPAGPAGPVPHRPDVVVTVLDESVARAIGSICAHPGHADVVDVHVVLEARLHGHQVVTSDPDDVRRVDPHVRMIVV